MRQSVVIDGITLTREQINRAASEINKPEPWVNLTRVKNVAAQSKGVVLRGYVQRQYALSLGWGCDMTIVRTDGQGLTASEETARKLGWVEDK